MVKTVRFADPVYVGDPINTVRIFNEKEVDELIFLDITATREKRKPQFELLGEIATECFMPFMYGGGVRDVEDMRRLFELGVEKVAINTFAYECPEFVTEAAKQFGSQSVAVAIDVRRKFWRTGYDVCVEGGRKSTGLDPCEYARRVEKLGAGEILLTSIDRDGTFEGYDLDIVSAVAKAVSVPVIACGGASCVEDFGRVVREAGASAVAAGSMMVYQGRNRAVLINYPERSELKRILE